jgi:hypothetical protein
MCHLPKATFVTMILQGTANYLNWTSRFAGIPESDKKLKDNEQMSPQPDVRRAPGSQALERHQESSTQSGSQKLLNNQPPVFPTTAEV